MTQVQDGIYERLASITEITSQISTYMSKPAIFTRSRIPGDAVARYIVIDDAIGDVPWDTKTTLGREVLHDIFTYDFESGDPSVVQNVAELVRDVLHRQHINVSGYGPLIAVVSGPIVAPTDDQVYGRVVTARYNLIKRNG
jgi:hypothetical protein